MWSRSSPSAFGSLRIYGSKVRGDDHDESDIDLLVLIEACTIDDHDRVGRIASSISPVLTPMTRDFDAYHSPRSRASGFYENMRRGVCPPVTPGQSELAAAELASATQADEPDPPPDL